jgi:hypothetical protein
LPGFHKEVDEETGNSYQRFDNHPVEFNHADFFSVRWAGQEFRIPPGGDRLSTTPSTWRTTSSASASRRRRRRGSSPAPLSAPRCSRRSS